LLCVVGGGGGGGGGGGVGGGGGGGGGRLIINVLSQGGGKGGAHATRDNNLSAGSTHPRVITVVITRRGCGCGRMRMRLCRQGPCVATAMTERAAPMVVVF